MVDESARCAASEWRTWTDGVAISDDEVISQIKSVPTHFAPDGAAAPAVPSSSTPASQTPPAQPITPSAPSVPSAAAPSAPAATTVPGSPSATGSPAPTVPGGGAPPADQQQWTGVRDALREQGIDVSGFQSDQAALQQLALAYLNGQRTQPVMQMAQQWLPHAAEIQKFLSERQTQQQQAAEQKKNWLNAPAYDPSWRYQLQRDAQGNIVPVPGAPSDLVTKYQQAEQFRQQFMDKFAFDPIGAIKPGLEEYVREMAGSLIQEHLGKFGQQSQAERFVTENQQWLYQTGPMGERALSPAGQRFGQFVTEAEGLGIQGVEKQQTYALQRLQGELALQKLQSGQGNAAQTGQQLQQQFVQAGQQPGQPVPGATNAPNSSGSLTPPTNPNVPANPFNTAKPSPRDLLGLMRERMIQGGHRPGQPVDLLRE